MARRRYAAAPTSTASPDVPASHRRELRRANEITRRTTILLRAAHSTGADFVIENPADRGNPADHLLFQVAEHGPIWLDQHMIELARACSTESATFAQCRFGGASQKYTTLWFTAGMAPYLRPLRGMLCNHAPGSHASSAGGVLQADGTWNSAAAAAYPSDFNLLIADSLAQLLASSASPITLVPTLMPQPDAPAPDAGVAPSVPIAGAPEPSPAPDASPSPAAVEPDSEDGAPSPPPPRARRRHIPAEERFHRGLGAIHTRSRGHVSLAKRGADDPANHRHAMELDPVGWLNSELAEILNHEKNGSWAYIDRSALPRGRRIVKLTWAYKVKRDGRQKSRLCVQGCTQVAGIDYDQTFCAAMRSTTLRILCSISARLGLQMHRWDFVAAYLQGDLLAGEVVYCSPAPGYATALADGVVHMVPASEGDGIERLCRVEKPVYGMAQAGRRWQRTIFPWLLAWNVGVAGAPCLRQSQLDTCVFWCYHTTSTPRGPREEVIFVGCYVDDLFILSSHTDEHSLYHHFTTDLSSKWDVEDEGPVEDLLNVEISREDEHVVLRQTAYIDKLMRTYYPDGVSVSPFGAGYPLSSHPASRVPADAALPQLVLDAVGQDAADIDPTLLKSYQSLVGALLYCSVNTRPDVAYAVGLLCRAMGKPTPALYEAALRVLFYLHHHRRLGLRYGASEFELSGMSDSDWAVRHSTTGFLFTYNLAAISWSSKKQTSVALSSCEAEIMAVSEAAKEGVYLRRFLDELGLGSSSATALATDNKAARDLAYNPADLNRIVKT